MEEPIPIMTNLIHHVSQLPCKGDDPADISEWKGTDLVITEAMKKKYKLQNKKRGNAISNNKEKAMCIATQMLAGKIMRKFRVDEIPMFS